MKPLLFLLLALAVPSFAQDIPIQVRVAPGPAPLGYVKATLYDDNNRSSKWLLPIPHRVDDRAFWLTQLVSEASTIIDVENTEYCLRVRPCQEGNPLFFSRHPSRIRMYSITTGINALAGYMAWRQKRKEDAEKAFGMRVPQPRWYGIPLVVIGSHVLGTALSAGITGR